MVVPQRQIRALFDEKSIRVYQAYSHLIADSALEAGRFVAPPFKMDRMTWIKPSFLWMMYRSGWGTKPGQECVLAIDITREGLEWALAHSCLSHFEPDVHESHEQWLEMKAISPVRIQWDPERDVHLERLDYRSIQIGLSGEAVKKYVNEWIVGIKPVNINRTLDPRARTVPQERAYPLPSTLSQRTGIAKISE